MKKCKAPYLSQADFERTLAAQDGANALRNQAIIHLSHHKVPVSRGGSRADIDNCVWCDRNINAFKNDSTDVEFIDICKRIADRFL